MTTNTKINVTKHALERWAERILNVDKSQIAMYVNTNRDQLIEHINETFKYSEFIYKGQLGTDNITRHFYIQGDIVFLTNTDNTAIITVYKVDLGFTPELNSHVRKGLIEEVHKLVAQKEELDFEVLQQVENKQHEISTIDDNIVILQRQIDELKLQKKVLNDELKAINSKSNYINQELSKFVLMLVNSKEYKQDIQSL